MLNFQIASPLDAKKLLEIQVKTFDDDSKRFFGRESGGPSNYDSLDTLLFNIENTIYFKIIYHEEIAGGIHIEALTDAHYQLQGIFIDPEVQNSGIGQKAMNFIEQKFSQVKTWTLDTPSPCIRNHYLYEKLGYKKVNEMLLDQKLSLSLYFYEKTVQ